MTADKEISRRIRILTYNIRYGELKQYPGIASERDVVQRFIYYYSETLFRNRFQQFSRTFRSAIIQ